MTLPGAQGQQKAANACPFCGGTGEDCCSKQDQATISTHARDRYRDTAAGDPQTAVPQSAAQDTPDDETTLAPLQGHSIEPSIARAVTPGQEGDAPAQDAPGDDNGRSAASYHGLKGDHESTQDDGGKGEEEAAADSSDKRKPNGEKLSSEEEEKVEELEQRDREVRQHEQAHLAAAGHLANGGARFEYDQGPDGRQYAVGGHVNISFGGGDEPEERLRDAEQAERAALAPAEPSPQDRKVASKARQAANDARQDLSEERAEEAKETSTDADAGQSSGIGRATGETLVGRTAGSGNATGHAASNRPASGDEEESSGFGGPAQAGPQVDRSRDEHPAGVFGATPPEQKPSSSNHTPPDPGQGTSKHDRDDIAPDIDDGPSIRQQGKLEMHRMAASYGDQRIAAPTRNFALATIGSRVHTFA
ncbi:hypothetical protein GF324_12525 [bacterium]|nr:hypothetical protein [bacterium]